MDHILSELSAMTRPSWVALHSMAHSFIELDKALMHVISLVLHIYMCVCVCVCVKGCSYEPCATQGLVTSGGEDFNPGPEMRLDHSGLCVAKFC